MNKEKRFIDLQLFAEPAEGTGDSTTDNKTTPPAPTAEETEKLKADIAKLKAALDKTNSENAEYKRKVRDTMSQQEKEALEKEAKEAEIALLRQEVGRSKAEKIFAAKGIEESTYAPILEIAVGALDTEAVTKLSTSIADAIEKSCKAAVALNENVLKQKGVVFPSGHKDNDKAKSLGQLLAEDTKAVAFDEIKKKY